MTSDDEIREVTEKFALQNAIQFDGKSDVKAVIGKVIGFFKKKDVPPKRIIPIVQSTVKDVNKKSLTEQKQRLQKIAPAFLKKEKKSKKLALPDLPHAEKGKVVTRFPPEPNGYLHIGHAKASIIDHEYARRYDGKFILRFDDTNPENAIPEFYEAQKEDLKWLGIKWDEEYHTSDNIERHYELAEKLITDGNAYVCTCESDKIKECRYDGVECECRHAECAGSIDKWKEMIEGGLDGAILRLKGDMTCDNTAMRDPTLFRIIEKPHPLQGDKYRVWPTYDFAGAIEDSISGVTHPFRTKEYELRDECYFRLLDLLELRKPHLMEFSRLSIEGMPVSKRKIKPLIEQGKVDGFDDIRLPTLRGLKRRGIVPKAIKNFVLSQGISKTESVVPFSLIESENRKVIDPVAKRYFFVSQPVKLVVENSPKRKQKISLHPSNNNLGSRTISTDGHFFIPKKDKDDISIDEIFRLKDLYNVKMEKKNKKITGSFEGDKLISDSAKIQWVTNDHIKMDVFVPHSLFENQKYNPDSLEKISGYAEKAVSSVENGEIVQFERFGFVRIEKQKDRIIALFAHK